MGETNEERQHVQELLDAARRGSYGLPETTEHGHQHGEPGVTRTVRTAVHHGKTIRIETTYRVTIDGEPLKGMLEVLDNGLVHYHGLPQYALPSAVDMVRRVIDYFGAKPPVEDEIGTLVQGGA
jgi:hypothetical protein